MELKEATNFLLIKDYIRERNYCLHFFENLIIQDCLIYFLEPQLFFFLECGVDLNLSVLQEQYATFLKDYSSCFMQVAHCNDEGDIWIRKKDIVHWEEIKKYEQGRERKEWIPCFGDIWNYFPNGLTGHDYKLLHIDTLLRLVVFYKKLQFVPTGKNKGKIIQYAYQLRYQKPCDVLYDSFDDISYSFLDNEETINQLGIEDYFRWLRYYKEQEEELIKKLVQ